MPERNASEIQESLVIRHNISHQHDVTFRIRGESLQNDVWEIFQDFPRLYSKSPITQNDRTNRTSETNGKSVHKTVPRSRTETQSLPMKDNSKIQGPRSTKWSIENWITSMVLEPIQKEGRVWIHSSQMVWTMEGYQDTRTSSHHHHLRMV